MSVITHLKKSGNSLALHMPKDFTAAHNLTPSLRFRMDFIDGKIVVEPCSIITDEEAEHNRLFDELTLGMSPETVDVTMLKGRPRGEELL
ncbi:hypothetical protein [Asticcacaulis sp. W401b]|uniref:AbrB/MazE/SpoVT family DNA-binding domain-containing protein n=1 Tax=Asticcacaulis sp. W401b TaxID=3388666 RepID=UPI003971037C